MEANQRDILRLTVVLEGAMFLIGGGWILFRGIPFSLALSPSALFGSILLAVFLLLVNLALLRILPNIGETGRQLEEFLQLAALPLAKSLSPTGAFIISVFAGVGEETLFRGAIQGEAGIIISSALFALFHFGRNSSQFPRVLAIYFLLSLTFGYLVAVTHSLVPAIIAHALYDFVLLTALRHYDGRTSPAR